MMSTKPISNTSLSLFFLSCKFTISSVNSVPMWTGLWPVSLEYFNLSYKDRGRASQCSCCYICWWMNTLHSGLHRIHLNYFAKNWISVCTGDRWTGQWTWWSPTNVCSSTPRSSRSCSSWSAVSGCWKKSSIDWNGVGFHLCVDVDHRIMSRSKR